MESNKEYLSRLMGELETEGVKPVDNSKIAGTLGNKVPSVDDIGLQTILKMEQVSGVKYSDEQKEILLHKGNACILACAGSGKTTTSVHLIAKRILTGEVDPDKMMFSTYSKSGANEMKVRLEKLLQTLGVKKSIQVRTLHSFFLHLLRTFGVTADIIKDYDRTKYIKEACKDADYLPKDDELILIDTLLSYQVNNLLSDKKTIASYVNTIDDLTLEQYSKIRVGYANRKSQAGVIDYDDMQSYLYLWLCKFSQSDKENERAIALSVKNYCKAMWTDFFIDEAQDVSKIQFAIVRSIITDIEDDTKLDRGLILVGDDDQAIYQWRGSDPSIILSIGPMFDIKTFVLSTNYRCKSNIVNFASRGVKCNSGRYDKSMKAFNEGGDVKILPSSKEDLCSLSKLAVHHIKWWIQQGNELSDIAVLARNNFHLAILSNMLLREGIYCYMSEDMKMTKSFMYKEVRKLIEMSKDTWNHDTTSTMLWKMCKFMSTSNAKMIADFQNNSALSLKDTLGYILKNMYGAPIEFSKNLKISIQAFDKLKFALSRFAHETVNDLGALYASMDNPDEVEALKGLMFQYIENTQYLYKSKDKQRSIRGMCNYIIEIIRKDGYDKLVQFLRVTEQFESGKAGIIGDRVTLTTLHSAKGREWKNVIMFACDNVSQPSLDGINKLAQDGVSTQDIFENIEEERRLCYVGNTRAKDNLLIITNKMPSMFILEALGAITDNCNVRIYDLALDESFIDRYLPFVSKYITNENSEYYYDINNYKLN